MKSDIHPKYYSEAKVTCSCGETFETGSTMSEIKVEICSACHPFFTGEMRFVDTQGRVEKFEAMRKKAAALQKELGKKKSKNDNAIKADQSPKSLKDMMKEVVKEQTGSQKSQTKKDSSKK